MSYTGRCYCGDLHYEFTGPIHSQILCHCRECRYLSGGAANTSVVISEDALNGQKGHPAPLREAISMLQEPATSVENVELIFASKAHRVPVCWC